MLLANLGTPDGYDYWPMRRYLKEFLSDRRVIETNPVLWWFILNGIILTLRPQKSGKAYEKIWNKALNESPLKTITRAQSEKLAAAIADHTISVVDRGRDGTHRYRIIIDDEIRMRRSTAAEAADHVLTELNLLAIANTPGKLLFHGGAVERDGQVVALTDPPKLEKQIKHTIDVVIDRLVAKGADDTTAKRRLTDSVETALGLARGLLVVEFVDRAFNNQTAVVLRRHPEG